VVFIIIQKLFVEKYTQRFCQKVSISSSKALKNHYFSRATEALNLSQLELNLILRLLEAVNGQIREFEVISRPKSVYLYLMDKN